MIPVPTSAAPALTRIGVFGGAFDPPHQAHLALAKTAIEQLKLDKLLIFPTGDAWHKTRKLSPAQHRLAMSHLAFGDLPQAQVCDNEILRTGPSYTIDTLEQIAQQYPGAELFLILGQDQVENLTQWHRWQDLLSMATIAVAARTKNENAYFATQPNLEQAAPPTTFALEGVKNVPKGQFARIMMPDMPISSTQLRHSIQTATMPAHGLDPKVASYIANQHLYRE